MAPTPNVGRPVAAGVFTSAAQVVYASGKTMKSTSDCAQWTTQDSPVFQGSGVCV